MKKWKSFIAVLISTSILLSSFTYGATLPKKEETVYVTLTPWGTPEEIIVSNWIHSENVNEPIKDISSLKNIINVKGDEEPEQEGDLITWHMNENDLFYQGTTDENLPLSIQILYFLDGVEINPEDLGGKTGHLKLHLSINNLDTHKKLIKGKTRDMFTPFAVGVLMNFPLDIFQNIEVNTGRILSDGTRKIGAFVLFPGMKENFEKESSFIDLPDFIEVSADVVDFEMGPIFITATPNIPSLEKLDQMDGLHELIDGIDQLHEASQELAKGTDELAQGQGLLYENLLKFTNGLKQYNQGSDEMFRGIDQIHQGSLQTKDGALQVSNGLKILDENINKWGQGAGEWSKGALEYGEQTIKFAKGASALSEGTQEIITAGQQLSEGANELTLGTEQLIQGQKQISDGMKESIQAMTSLQSGKEKEQKVIGVLLKGTEQLIQILDFLNKIPGTTKIVEKLQDGLAQQQSMLIQLLETAQQSLEGLMILEQGLNQVHQASIQMEEELQALQGEQTQLAQGLDFLKKGTQSLEPAAKQLTEGGQGLAEGAQKLQESGLQLTQGAQDLREGSTALSKGAQEVSKGIMQLTTGTENLNKGAQELKLGKIELERGSEQLMQGAQTLTEGTETLNKHMHEFSQEGTQKLHDEISSSNATNDILDVKDALVDLSKEYRSFSGADKDMESSVSFIMRTQEIKRPKVKTEMIIPIDVTENKAPSFFEKLFSFFKRSK